jgi:hypothetical protein
LTISIDQIREQQEEDDEAVSISGGIAKSQLDLFSSYTVQVVGSSGGRRRIFQMDYTGAQWCTIPSSLSAFAEKHQNEVRW